MNEKMEQAIALTQQAVGQVQGMFKRLAAKMEADVLTMKTSIERLAGAVVKLQHEVAELKRDARDAKARSGPPSVVDAAMYGSFPEATASRQRAAPATVDGKRVQAEVLPRGSADDAFHSGADED